MIHLLRPPRIGIFPGSFRLRRPHYVREMIPETCSMWDSLATVPISQTGSQRGRYTRNQ
jgi:hypothetical protein